MYKSKDNLSNDKTKIFKDWLIAGGFTYDKGVNHDEVFSPIANYATIFLVCALAKIFSLVMDQMNVGIAFLYKYLEK